MKISKSLLSISAAAFVSLILTAGCSKEDKWAPVPYTPQYLVSSTEGYWNPIFERERLTVPRSGSHLSLPISIGEAESIFDLDHPYPEYKKSDSDTEAYWAAIYADTELSYMSWKESPLFSPGDIEWNKISMIHSSENVWEGEGFKVERVWNGDSYTLEVTIPENTMYRNRKIEFGWRYCGRDYVEGYAQIGTIICITQDGKMTEEL